MTDDRLRVGSLFAGIGGFDLGLERTGGFRTVWFCEQDRFCQHVLAQRWLGVPCYPDIRLLRGADIEPVDVLCGGFPCQDLSLAGKGAGLDGARSGLWSEYARLVRELRPRYVLVENVSALLRRGLGRVLGDLAACGYDAEWDCIPASRIGAPHQRDRVWLVAYPNGDGVRLESERHQRGERRESAAVGGDAEPAHDGAEELVADHQGNGRRARRSRRPDSGGPGERQSERALPDMADAARDMSAGATPAGAVRERAGAGGEPGGARDAADPDGGGQRTDESDVSPGEPDAPGGCWLCEWAEEHYLERGAGLDEWIAQFRAEHSCSRFSDADRWRRKGIRQQDVARLEREARALVNGRGGARPDVADTASARREGRPEQVESREGRRAVTGGRGEVAADASSEPADVHAGQPAGLEPEGGLEPCVGGGELADTERAGLEGHERVTGEQEVSEPWDGCAPGSWVGDGGGNLADWWTVEPDVGRVAHGVPLRVDRLRSLGNSLVPQISEWVGWRILEWEASAEEIERAGV